MIIGISGKIGSGKDTVARKIIQSFPDHRFENKKFAYNVKKICSILTGFYMKNFLSREGKKIFLTDWNMSIGQMQQIVATELFRDKLNYNSWVISLFSKYNENNSNWVISDVRFLNEAEEIKKRGGILIRLEGDPSNILKNEKRDLNHISETDLDNYDKFDIVYKNIPPRENLNNLMVEIEKIINKINK